MKIKEHKWSLLKYGLILIGLLFYIGVGIYWSQVCEAELCSYGFMANFLLPLKYSGLVLVVLLSPFLFLPAHYFKSYFKKIFWWTALIFFLNVASNDSSSSEWVDRTDMVFISGAITAVITLVFIVLHYQESKKKIMNP
jgi:hypothetical protein